MHTSLRLLALLVCLAVFTVSASAADWPQWRGPDGNGVSRETGLPLTWSDSAGVVWKCDLPAWGNSTPAIWGDAVFLTSHVEDRDLVLLRINKKTGRIEWTRKVGAAAAPRAASLHKSGDARRHQKFHESQNLATPSPVTDGEVVVVHFGNGDLAAYDLASKALWQRNLQKDHGDYSIWWGHANSPVLCGDLVLSVCMQDSCKDLPGEPSPSYVVAHDKKTGQQKWHAPRMTAATAESCDSYTTPLLWQRDGRTEMIVWGGQVLDAYDPATGKQLWSLAGLSGNRVIPNPVVANGTIYAIQGMRQALLAVKPGGDGQRPPSDIAWKFDQGTSDSPSPVVAGDLLFMVTNDGIVRCLDARDGRLHWKERLKGEFRSSPLLAEGRVYFTNVRGQTTVIAAAPQYEKLAENQLPDEVIASPAVSDGKIFLRGRKALYCLGK
jgi:outer membrane protein assembly factor BamB